MSQIFIRLTALSRCPRDSNNVNPNATTDIDDCRLLTPQIEIQNSYICCQWLLLYLSLWIWVLNDDSPFHEQLSRCPQILLLCILYTSPLRRTFSCVIDKLFVVVLVLDPAEYFCIIWSLVMRSNEAASQQRSRRSAHFAGRAANKQMLQLTSERVK